MYDADNSLISKIAAVTPTYNDSWYGLQTIGDGSVASDMDDFGTSDGSVTWWGALAFVNYLNSINYGGNNQWYLPTVANTSLGYNTTSNGTVKGDELVELFYQELNGTADSNIPNTANFNNERASAYWSGTVYAPGRSDAWLLFNQDGRQLNYNKNTPFYAWAVSPGQIAAVPEPESVAMLLLGLGVVAGVVRRRRA